MKETGLIFGTESVSAILEGRKTMTRRVIVLRGKAHKFMREHGYNTIQSDEVIYPDGGGNWIGWDKDQPGLAEFTQKAYPNGEGFKCPYGHVDDRLKVKESWAVGSFSQTFEATHLKVLYKSPPTHLVVLYKTIHDDNNDRKWCVVPHETWQKYAHHNQWRSPLFMPRWASRLTLEITALRAERLQEITVEDCLREGLMLNYQPANELPPRFHLLWDSLNKKRGHGWDKNEWVWVISFRRVGNGPM